MKLDIVKVTDDFHRSGRKRAERKDAPEAKNAANKGQATRSKKTSIEQVTERIGNKSSEVLSDADCNLKHRRFFEFLNYFSRIRN